MSIFRYSEYPWFLRPVLYFVQKVVLGDALGGKYFDNFRTRENVEAILKSQGVSHTRHGIVYFYFSYYFENGTENNLLVI